LISQLQIDKEKEDVYFLNLVFLAIFLLYSLRASSVGRDLPGYKRVYELTKSVEWNRWTYVYFENGYILLMKVCNALNMSFQQFLTVVNIIILVPIYVAIRKYSKRPFLSVMIYVCYIFFEFNMSGIRQAIATSIVLVGYLLLLGSKRFPLLKYIICATIACFFHSGAFAAFLYVPFHYIIDLKKYTSSIIAFIGVLLLGRNYIMVYIKELFEKDSMRTDAGLYIGLNFLFLVILAIGFIMGNILRGDDDRRIITVNEERYSSIYSLDTVNLKMFLLSICFLCLFGSDTAVRSYMLLNQVVILQLPNCLDEIFDERSQSITYMILIVFLVVFMFMNTLLPNNFDIVPYRFFWQ
jgi:transmembrane protein EpsG